MSNTAGIDNHYLRGIRSLTPLSHETFKSSDVHESDELESDEYESDDYESDEYESDEYESDEHENDEIYGVSSARNSGTGLENDVEVKSYAAHSSRK